MQIQKPDNELTRVSFLRSADILDSPAEEAYERIVRMACRVLDFSRCAITLVDESRVWVKASRGIRFDEIPRDQSFCTYAILNNDAMVVADAASDERFRELGLVQGSEKLTFYCGCPIRLSPDVPVGMLSVFDTQPRTLSDDDLEFLQDLADSAGSQIKARLLRNFYA